MAVTYTVSQIERRHQLGDVRAIAATVTASGTYTATGDSLDLASLLGLNRIDMVIFDGEASVPGSGGTTSASPAFDYTNKKLKFYGGNAINLVNGELSAGTTLTNFSCRVLALGA
jgi:hypothetical protein